jgi:hypothetical protein
MTTNGPSASTQGKAIEVGVPVDDPGVDDPESAADHVLELIDQIATGE